MLKKSANLQASIPHRQKLNLSRFIKARQMSRSIELTGFQIIANNVFILKGFWKIKITETIGHTYAYMRMRMHTQAMCVC